MGSSETRESTYDSNFQMHKYLNQGLNQQQIIMIRKAFESYSPIEGEIPLDKYKECIFHSEVNESISKKLGNRKTLNFDQFFSIEKDILLTQIQKNPKIEIDSTQVPPPSNFLCPYAQEVVRN